MNIELFARYALGYLVQVLPCGLLLLFCFRDSLRVSFPKAACVACGVPVLCAALFAAAAAWVGYDYTAIQIMFYASTLVYLALFLLLAKGPFIMKAFAFVIVFCYGVYVSTAELALSSALMFRAEGGMVYYWHDIALFAVITGISVPLFAKQMRYVHSLLPDWEDRRFLAACCLVLGCYTLAVSVCVLAANNVMQRGLFLLISLTGLMGGMAVFYLICLLFKRLSVQKDMADWMLTAENQLELQKAQYQRMAEHMEQTRKTRHDFRHHIAVLNSLASEGNLSGVKKYLAEYTRSIPAERDEPLCRNHIVDMLARHYLSMARQEGVECTVRLALPPELPIADMDLCIVLGNCLENAVEACRKVPAGNRYIHLAGKVEGEALAITLDNSFQGGGPDGDGVPRSSKPSGGVGLQNVRAVAEKYGGQAIFRGQEDVFESSIVMFFPQDTDDSDGE